MTRQTSADQSLIFFIRILSPIFLNIPAHQSTASPAVTQLQVQQHTSDSAKTTTKRNDDLQKEKQDLGPAAFWTSLGITGALAVGEGIVDAVAYNKIRHYRDKAPVDRTQEEKETAQDWKTASQALLGITAAGVLTTVVLGLFTNFDTNKVTI